MYVLSESRSFRPSSKSSSSSKTPSDHCADPEIKGSPLGPFLVPSDLGLDWSQLSPPAPTPSPASGTVSQYSATPDSSPPAASWSPEPGSRPAKKRRLDALVEEVVEEEAVEKEALPEEPGGETQAER